MQTEKSSDTVRETLFRPHPFQERALLSNKRFIAMVAGIQSGKTTTGAYWKIGQVRKYPRDNHLICADTYKRLEQSTLIKFFEIFPRSWGEHKAQKQLIELNEGGIIFFRSLDDPDAIEGIPDVRSAWMDEGGKANRKAWVNFQGRLARLQGQGLITTTPYAFNWLFNDFYKRWLRGEPDYDVIQFESIANPSFPKAEFERLKGELSEAEFKRKYCGNFARMEGLVYELQTEAIVESIEAQGLTYYGGIDWGFTNPCALVVVGVDSDINIAQVDEYYQTKKTTPELIEAAKKLQAKYGIKLWYADPEDPEKIAQFNKAGLRTIAAKNEWELGRDALTKVLRAPGRYKIVRKDCPNTLEEFETHHYPEGTDEKGEKEAPIDANNHALSALRYIVVMVEGGTGKIRNTTPGLPLNQKERIERLLQDKNGRGRVRRKTKDWYYQ
jgi:PBSX family phage terminase large subunit